MSSFSMTTPETTVNLRPAAVKSAEIASGTVSYSITNRTGATVRTRVRVDSMEGAEQSWFSVRGGEEREIGPGATESVSIDLSVPGGSGNHLFRAIAINLADPDNDYETGATVAFDRPSLVADNGKIKWWMIAIPIALIAIVGGVIAAFLIDGRGDPPPPRPEPGETVVIPNFIGSPIEKARETLNSRGINFEERQVTNRQPEIGKERFYSRKVKDQEPDISGRAMEIESTDQVVLFWDWEPIKVDVPAVANLRIGAAVDKIQAAGLEVGSAIQPATPQPGTGYYTVVASAHPSGKVDAFTKVTLTMKWKKASDPRKALELQIKDKDLLKRLHFNNN
jgi:hypothetical protein